MLFKIAVPFLLYLPSLAHARAFVPFKDSKCSQPMKIKSEGKEISELPINAALTSGGGGTWYDEMEFPEAKDLGATTGQGSNVVYWKVPKPDATCIYTLMQQHGLGWQIATYLPGDVIVNADREGCFFSAIEPNKGLITSFCCGKGDCAPLDLASGQFLVNGKRDLETIAEPEPEHKVPAKRASLSSTVHASDVVRSERLYLSKRADNGPPEQCKIVGQTSKSTSAGPQQAVANPQPCTGPTACSFNVQVLAGYSTAVSKGSSSTWTVTGTAEVSFKAGIDFFVNAEASTSWSASIAKAWETNESKTVTESKLEGITQQIVQQVGTTAMLTFRPIYECTHGDAVCGKDKDGNEIRVSDWDVCEPHKNGNRISGDYVMVYI